MANKKFDQFTAGGEMQVGDIPVGLRSSNLATNFQFDFPGTGIKDSNGNHLFQYETAGALAVNNPNLVNSLTDQPVIYGAAGTDTDISIAITPKNAGDLFLDGLRWPVSDGAASQAIVTDGAGRLSFSSTIIPAVVIAGTTQQMVPDTLYITTNAALTTLTLPATMAAGELMKVIGYGSGGWLIAQNSGQTIHWGSHNSTTGVAGSLTSTFHTDCFEIVCVNTNTDFVISASQGNSLIS